jgi:hypothetical protein
VNLNTPFFVVRYDFALQRSEAETRMRAVAPE